MPLPADSERPKTYVPRNPYPTPNSFPQTPAAVFDSPTVFEKFDTDTVTHSIYYPVGPIVLTGYFFVVGSCSSFSITSRAPTSSTSPLASLRNNRGDIIRSTLLGSSGMRSRRSLPTNTSRGLTCISTMRLVGANASNQSSPSSTDIWRMSCRFERNIPRHNRPDVGLRALWALMSPSPSV